MSTGVVQFREPKETLAYLEGKGINPNQFAREAFEAMVRKMRIEESMDELSKVQAKLPRPIEEIIREDRDSR